MVEMEQISQHTEGEIAMLGVSHRTADLSALERIALSSDEVLGLKSMLSDVLGSHESLVLSTCNRTEIYVAAPCSSTEISQKIKRCAQEFLGDRLPEASSMIRHESIAAVRHLFELSCGLDSLILGEAQILGQVRGAAAAQNISEKHVLGRVLNSAYKVAKRCRTNSEIGEGSVSVASAAVQLVSRVYSDLSQRTVAVLGAGETGRLVTEHLMKRSPKKLIVLNRTQEKAHALANRFSGEGLSLQSLPQVLQSVDVLITAAKTDSPLVTRDLLKDAQRHRSGRTLVLCDIGLPRNISPESKTIAEVLLYDLNALNKVVDANLARRRKAVPAVHAMIDEAIVKMNSQARENAIGPLIGSLRQRAEAARQKEVARAILGLSTAEAEAVDRVTKTVMNALLHKPTIALKSIAKKQESDRQTMEALAEFLGAIERTEN